MSKFKVGDKVFGEHLESDTAMYGEVISAPPDSQYFRVRPFGGEPDQYFPFAEHELSLFNGKIPNAVTREALAELRRKDVELSVHDGTLTEASALLQILVSARPSESPITLAKEARDAVKELLK